MEILGNFKPRKLTGRTPKACRISGWLKIRLEQEQVPWPFQKLGHRSPRNIVLQSERHEKEVPARVKWNIKSQGGWLRLGDAPTPARYGRSPQVQPMGSTYSFLKRKSGGC